MRKPGAVVVVVAWVWTVACGSTAKTPGYPLYQASGAPLPTEQVARLFGRIFKVDGRDVSALGGAYELLPGCHTVLTEPVNLGGVTSNVTMRGQLVPRTFAVPMKQGYSYVVKNTPPQIHDPPRLYVAEVDPGGAQSQVIYPATGEQLNACKQEPGRGD